VGMAALNGGIVINDTTGTINIDANYGKPAAAPRVQRRDDRGAVGQLTGSVADQPVRTQEKAKVKRQKAKVVLRPCRLLRPARSQEGVKTEKQ